MGKERLQKVRKASERKDEGPGTPIPTENLSEPLKAELDDILDEIDEVLEENAEEFVAGYVQKGGE